jgi:hypothetical protein
MSNTTIITGNLTREPEIRYTKDGQGTAQLTSGGPSGPALADPGHSGMAGVHVLLRRRVLA